jgi:hypothetical protein
MLMPASSATAAIATAVNRTTLRCGDPSKRLTGDARLSYKPVALENASLPVLIGLWRLRLDPELSANPHSRGQRAGGTRLDTQIVHSPRIRVIKPCNSPKSSTHKLGLGLSLVDSSVPLVERSRSSSTLTSFSSAVISSSFCMTGSSPAARRRSSVRETNPLVIAAVTTAISDKPPSIRNAAMTLPAVWLGTTSPYPTVVTVSTAHHIPIHTLGNVFGSTARSTTPNTTTAIAQKVAIR